MAFGERLNALTLDRRKLLVGAAAGGGLLVAWWLWPRRYESPLPAREGERQFGGWITIGRDGVVTVAVPQLEMGQGVTTLLPQVVAVELGADWRQVAVEPAPPGGLFANLPLAAKWAPLWSSLPALANTPDSRAVEDFARDTGFAATADGLSLEAYEAPLRNAAAAARAMLAMAAADRWDVAPEECEAADGFIHHGDRRLRFGELVDEAAEYDPPDPPPLRPLPASERPVDGEEEVATAFPRLDLPAKVEGSLLFAGDVRLPGMVYAAIRHGPVGSELARFDEGKAAGINGLIGVVRARRWLAAAAASWWIADRALDRLAPVFAGRNPPDSRTIHAALDKALRSEDDERIITIGDPDDLLEQPGMVRRYDIAPAAHCGIETSSATARLADGRLELWVAAQAPDAVIAAAAKAVGISPRAVVLYPVAAGGSFDARLEKAHAIEAAQIAQQLGRPVQLTWSRAQELQAVPPRTPLSAEMSALAPGGGLPVAWRARLAMPATMREFGHRLFDNLTPAAAMARAAGEADPLACEGAVPPYAIANVAVDHIPASIAIPTGRMRGNALAYTAFLTESFIDELATEAAQDPFLYRMALLGKSPRLAECLRRATRLGAWDGGRRGTGQGVALVRLGTDAEGGGRIACVAQAGLAEGGVRVSRLSVAVDIGRIVNLDLARQQIEGGLIFGMAQAVGTALTFEEGMPRPLRLGQMGLPSLADAPAIAVDFVASDAPPCDPGELGVAVVGPAIANALFSATGRRFRRLPLLWDPT